MKKYVKKKPSLISRLLSKFLVFVIIVLSCMIVLKGNDDLKDKFKRYVFESNFSFAKINSLYTKYFGSIVPTKGDSVMVSNFNIDYSSLNSYKDGVKLNVSNDYTLSNLNSGLVIYVGEKEGYGNTVVVQRPDNVEVWYSNIKNVGVSIYDYIKKGDILGESDGDFIYLVFVKDGEFLDYKEFI